MLGLGTMSEGAEIALITSILSLAGVFVTAFFSYRASIRATQARDHAARASNEITNAHTVNLRVDLDQRFEHLDRRLDGIETDLRENRRQATIDAARHLNLERRIHDLETR